ncbi:MAG: YfiR family protein [Desulfuromonadales bacterium]|nr:YfiR family protein [Desulfuromonadales bacterium]
MKRLFSLPKYVTLFLVLLLLLVFIPHPATCARQDEYQVKAAFVLNFAKLTEWPNESQVEKDSFTIAILGKTPSDSFVNTLKSQTVHGNKVIVRHIDGTEEAKNARLVYISASERHHLSGILRELRQLNVLTVSDINGFCEFGGMIGLVPVQNRVGFEVNLAAVRKAHLSISSQLLKLAKTVLGN